MKRNRKRLICILSVLAVLVVLSAIACVVIFNRAQELDELQQEKLTELQQHEGEYDPQSIVLYDTSAAAAEKLADKLGAALRISQDGKFAALKLPEGTTIADVYADDANKAHLAEMSADYQVKTSALEEGSEGRMPTRPTATVNDPSYSLQTYLDYLNLGTVWNKTKGSGITVAIIDTGIDTDHPEFAGRISEYSYNATEDKIVKDYILEDGSYDWSLVEDEQGHGTGVAGALGASMNNNEGIVGVAPEVTIIVIKAECNANGAYARTSDLVFGLYYAIERDVSVVNMSFGAYSPTNPFADATRLAVDSDVICVAAAGNEGTTALCWPAADPNVIGVGALDADSWELAPYSNYGDNSDIVAPGTTYTAKMGGGYETVNGTSLASPVTAGVIALALTQERYATYEEVCTLLYASSYDLGDLGADWDYGFGAIDATALILEERGTITYDMLTDELEDETGIFIRNHTLQEMPAPERLYAIFDGWYYDPQCTQPYVYYEDRFVTDLTLYAHWVNEEDGVPYTYVELDDGTIEIRSYTGRRKYITIPEMIDGKPVTSIGDFAFSGESALREVWLPDCLTHIGRYAFENCSNLLHIDIPEGVSEIEEGAFYNNLRLSYVAFTGNSALEKIGNGAFAYCSKVTRFEVPAGVTALNGSAFVGTTSMQNFSVQINNTAFTAVNGVLLNYTASTVVAYPAGRTGNETLPVTIRTIGAYAFAYTKRTEIALDGVQSIGAYAFTCAALEALTIPDSVTSMGASAFEFNFYLREVSLGAGLTSLPRGVFGYAFMLNSIEIPEGITEIGAASFYKSALTSITFAENSRLMVIGAKAFAQNTLTGVEIPASVMAIGAEAFESNFALASVTFAEDSNLIFIDNQAFFRASALTVITLPARLATLGEYAFAESGLVGTIRIPASLTSFGAGAFASCSRLTAFAVEAGNTAYKAVKGVVYTLDGAALVAYPTGNTATSYTVVAGTQTIAARGFEGAANLTAVTLPTSLTAIEEYGMSAMTSLRNIAIPDNVMQIGRYAFNGNAKMTRATFGAGSKIPRISYAAFANSGLYSFTVPASVSTIAQGAFAGCNRISSITFAANSKLESISAYMFDGCRNLQTVTFQNGSALTSIQAHGFEGMSGLTTVNFGDAKLTNIDNFAFRFCDSLTTLALPETVTNIGRYAFYYCTNLTDLALPTSVERIGSFAFLGTNELNVYFTAETLPLCLDEDWDYGIAGYYLGVTNVITVGDWQYAMLTSGGVAILKYSGSETVTDLTSLDFGGNIVNIGGGAFAYTAVESITLPETLVTIQAEAFYHSALQSITVPASVQFIGREAFAETPLNVLTFARNSALKVIEQSAFEGTKSLGTVTLPTSLTTMGRAAFKNSGITVLNFADGIALTEIADEAFAYTDIITLALPDGITDIGDGAFRATAALESVTFSTGELMIRSNAFYQSGLMALHIPQNVTYIGEYAFVAMPRLTEFVVAKGNPYYKAVDGLLVSKTGRKLIAVPAGRTGELTLPVSIEVIGFGAFENTALSAVHFDEDANILSLGYRAFFGAKNLTSIHIPASVVAIDYYAFANCSALTTVTFAEGNQLRGVYEGAFYGCKNLADVMLSDSVVELSDFAFYGCAKLTNLPVSETSTIKGIYSYAMAYTGITGELVLPDTLYDIDAYAFRGIKATSIVIPNTLQKELIIGIGAFADCNNLAEITLPFIGASFEDGKITWFGYIFGAGGYEANDAYIPKSLKSVVIPEGITIVGRGAFYNTFTLERIALPHSVIQLDPECFFNCFAQYELTNTIYFKDGIMTDRFFDCKISQPHSGGYTLQTFPAGLRGTLKIAEGVHTIARDVLEDSELEAIIFPQSLHTIGVSFLSGSGKLREVRIPDGVTEVGYYAFSFCSLLERVTIGRGVQTIDVTAFTGSDCLSQIQISPENAYLCSVDNIIYSKDCSKIIVIPDGLYGKVALPEGLETIPAGMFGYSDICELIIPEGCVSIGAGAFASCGTLTKVTLSSTLKEIDRLAFGSCSNLYTIINHSPIDVMSHDQLGKYATLVIDREGNEWRYGEETILHTPDGFRFTYKEGQYTLIAYLGDESTVTLPLDINGCSYEIFQMRGVRNVIIPEGFTSISSCAFQSCKTLEMVSLPNSLQNIKSNAFSFTNLTTITIPSTVTNIDSNAFYNSSLRSLIVMQGSELQAIGERAFGSTSIEEVDLRNASKLKEIGTAAFIYCDELVRAYIPASVERVSGLFNDCDALAEVIVASDNPYITVKDGVVYDRAMTQIMDLLIPIEGEFVIPEGVEKILSGAFYNAGVTKLVCPSSLKVIEEGTFFSCSNLKELVLNDGLEYLSGFQACRALERITIPTTVQTMSNAFWECSSLREVSFAPNSNCTEIHGCFSSTLITEFVIPASVMRFSTNFQHCTYVHYIIEEGNQGDFEMPSNGLSGVLELADDEVFHAPHFDLHDQYVNVTGIVASPNHPLYTSKDGVLYNKEMTEIIYVPKGITGIVEIPDTVTDIDAAFSWCNQLTGVILPEGITRLEARAFLGCRSLLQITIPGTLTFIGENAFFSCESLSVIYNNSDMEIPLTVVEQGVVEYSLKMLVDKDGNKHYATGIEDYEIIETADGYRFAKENDWYYLLAYIGQETTIVLPATMQGSLYRIRSMNGMVNVTIPSGIEIEEDALFNNRTIRSIVIEKGITSIASKALANGSLAFITLPEGLEEIGYGAFSGCRNLTSITIPEGVMSIGSSVFSGCTSLTSITIPYSVTSIGDYAFSDCTSLTSITIPDSVTSIGAFAFIDCTSLTSITIPDSVTFIDRSAFKNTAYCNDCANWIGKGLYIGNHLIAVDTSVKRFHVREGTVSIVNDAFASCYALKLLTIGGDRFHGYYHAGILSYLTNLETLVVMQMPTHYISWYFSCDFSIPLTLKNIVLAEGIQMHDDAFLGFTGITIYVEATESDTRWDDNYPSWNNGNRVLYGDKWINATFYNPDGSILSKEIFTTSQVIRVPYLEIQGDAQYTYEVIGWDLDGDGTPDTVPATSTTDIVASPIVVAHTNSYTVTFLDKDGTTPLYTFVLPYGSTVPLPEVPTKKGYTFLGWGGYTEGMIVESDITITSIWQHEGTGHTYAAPVWVAPTCTERGYNKHICTVCDEWYGTDYVAELGHTYTVSTVAPTCIEQGYDQHVCACGHSYCDNFVAENGHSFGAWVTDVAATCTETGLCHRDCAACGEVEREAIAANGHAYTVTVLREPTCRSEGLLLHACDNCDSRIEEATGTAPHNYQKKYASKTFLQWLMELILDVFFGYEGERGYYYECADCRHVQTAAEQNSFASAKEVCVHEYSDVQVVKAATCTEQGISGRICSLCKAVSDANTFDALGHDHSTEWTVDVAPTCTTVGSKSHHCTRCEDKADATEIDALGHTWGDWYVLKAPTCTETGTDERECTVCHEKETRTVDANGHTSAVPVVENKVEPNCTEDGSYDSVVYCSVCAAELSREQKTIEKLGHDHSTEWTVDVAPTCTAVGSKSHHCTRCEDKADVTEIPALGHTWGDWYELKAPTCTETGTDERECTVCHEKETRTVDANGHTSAVPVVENKVEPNCTEDGSYDSVVYCSVCVAELSREQKTIEKLGHEHSTEWTVDVAPTCTTVGSKSHHCTRCEDKADVTEITALGHSFTDYRSNHDATYTDNGTETAKCDRCDVTDTRSDEGSALGLDQKFKDEMAALSENASTEMTYAELYAALQTYAALSDAEKMNVATEYAALEQLVEAYNIKAKTANAELANATEFAFAPIAATGFVFVAALWFLLRKKFFI